jgi:hypothetical protein
MNKQEHKELINSEEYKRYDQEFDYALDDEQDLYGYESAYDLAIARLIEKDKEIAELKRINTHLRLKDDGFEQRIQKFVDIGILQGDS